MKFAPYSYSKLSVHNQCNRKFKYKYIDKIPEPFKNKEALQKGKLVHKLFETYPNHTDNEHLDILSNFLKGRFSNLLKVDKIREFGIGLTKELEPCKYSKTAMFRGYIDYFTVIGDVMIIADWKTGKVKDLQYQDFNQLLFYSIYMFQKYKKIQKIKIMYIYVEHDMDNSIVLERKFLDKYISELRTSINNVENDTVFCKKTQVLCDYCGYKDICDKD